MPVRRNHNRRRLSASQTDEVIAEINITPLTDVLLVLLIIFLIAAAAGVFGFNLRLPKSQAPEFMKKQFKGIVITIPAWAQERKAVFVGSRLILLDILPNYLYQEHLRKKTDQAVLRIDRAVPYGTVINVMDAAETARLDKISLAAPVEQSHGQ